MNIASADLNSSENSLLQNGFSPTSSPLEISNNSKSKDQTVDIPLKSPNGTKSSVQHVPCKFFKNGACTAGKNCIFSHSKELTSTIAMCKYYAKGNCKFGNKCALQHGNEKKTNNIARTSTTRIKQANQYTLDKPRMFDHRPIFEFKSDELLSNSLARVSLENSFPTFNPAMNFYTPQPKTSQLSNIFASPSPSQANFSLSLPSNQIHDERGSILKPFDSLYNNSSFLEGHQSASYSERANPNGFLSPSFNFNFSNEQDFIPSSLDELLTPTELQMRRTKANVLNHNGINRQALNHDSLAFPPSSRFFNQFNDNNDNLFGSSLPSGSSLGFSNRAFINNIKGEEEIKAPNNSLFSEPYGLDMGSSPTDKNSNNDKEDNDSQNSSSDNKKPEGIFKDSSMNGEDDNIPFKMDGDF